MQKGGSVCIFIVTFLHVDASRLILSDRGLLRGQSVNEERDPVVISSYVALVVVVWAEFQLTCVGHIDASQRAGTLCASVVVCVMEEIHRGPSPASMSFRGAS